MASGFFYVTSALHPDVVLSHTTPTVRCAGFMSRKRSKQEKGCWDQGG